MKNWSAILTLGLLLSTKSSFAGAQHLGLQISSDAVHVALKSALDLMYGGKENAQIDIEGGRISKNFKLENEKYAKMVGAINELFALSAEKGLTVNVNYSDSKVKGFIGPNDIKYVIKKVSEEKFNISLSATVKELGVTLPTLTICTDIKYKQCQGGNFVKFKDIAVGLDPKGNPLVIKVDLEFSLTPVYKMVNGVKVLTKSISLVAKKSSSNLETKTSPRIYLNYFKGIRSGIEYPQVSANQVGPAEFGLSITSKDLKAEIELYKNDLGKQIVAAGHDFIAKDMIKFLNNVLEDREFSSDFWVNYTGKPLEVKKPIFITKTSPDPKNEYVAKIDNTYVYRAPIMIKQEPTILEYLSSMIHHLTYGIKLNTLNLPEINKKQYFNVMVDTDLFLNGELMKLLDTKGYGQCAIPKLPEPTPTAAPTYGGYIPEPMPRDNTYVAPSTAMIFKPKVYANCAKPLGSIAFAEANKAVPVHNMAFAVSESYINSVLKLADKQGIIKKLVKVALNKPGVYIGDEGIRVHVYKNPQGKTYLYLIVNMKIKLSEQPSWIDRNVGGWIEKWWGSTGGVVKFPLEIPVKFSVKETAEGQKIVMEGLSPFGANGHLVNTFGYFSNIDGAADTWVADIQEKIEDQIREGLVDIVSPDRKDYTTGRMYLQTKEFDVNELLGSLPADFKVTSIGMETSGHIVVYGKINKLDLKPLVQGRK